MNTSKVLGHFFKIQRFPNPIRTIHKIPDQYVVTKRREHLYQKYLEECKKAGESMKRITEISTKSKRLSEAPYFRHFKFDKEKWVKSFIFANVEGFLSKKEGFQGPLEDKCKKAPCPKSKSSTELYYGPPVKECPSDNPCYCPPKINCKGDPCKKKKDDPCKKKKEDPCKKKKEDPCKKKKEDPCKKKKEDPCKKKKEDPCKKKKEDPCKKKKEDPCKKKKEDPCKKKKEDPCKKKKEDPCKKKKEDPCKKKKEDPCKKKCSDIETPLKKWLMDKKEIIPACLAKNKEPIEKQEEQCEETTESEDQAKLGEVDILQQVDIVDKKGQTDGKTSYPPYNATSYYDVNVFLTPKRGEQPSATPQKEENEETQE